MAVGMGVGKEKVKFSVKVAYGVHHGKRMGNKGVNERKADVMQVAKCPSEAFPRDTHARATRSILFLMAFSMLP